MMTLEEKKERREKRKFQKSLENDLERVASERDNKNYDNIIINIEWINSRIWGANPHVTIWARETGVKNDDYYGTASGCGYDKESSAVASALNNGCLLYKLWGKVDSGEWSSAPYGVSCYTHAGLFPRPRFSCGVGISCMYKIAEWLGGTFRHVSGGKMFDVYELNF